MPVPSGRRTSRIQRLKENSPASWSASATVPAVTTVYPNSEREPAMRRRMSGSSSTCSIIGLVSSICTPSIFTFRACQLLAQQRSVVECHRIAREHLVFGLIKFFQFIVKIGSGGSDRPVGKTNLVGLVSHG